MPALTAWLKIGLGATRYLLATFFTGITATAGLVVLPLTLLVLRRWGRTGAPSRG